MNVKLFALLAAIAVRALWAVRHEIWAMIRNPSPADRGERGSWVKGLFSKGSDPDPDPDEDDEGEEPYVRGYDLVDDAQTPGRVRVEWLNTPRPERRDDRKERTNGIDSHITGLINKGWRTTEILDDTMTEFGVSESTAKRALRRVRNEDR